MILVDTSVWVAALRSAKGWEAEELRVLLDADQVALAAPVRLEILAGASVESQPRLRRLLSALPCWLPAPSTWALIESWLSTTVAAGQRFGVADLLIAAIAVEHDSAVWSLDQDFERMARLGLLHLHSQGAG